MHFLAARRSTKKAEVNLSWSKLVRYLWKRSNGAEKFGWGLQVAGRGGGGWGGARRRKENWQQLRSDGEQ